jgi:hypothetical protein
MHELAWQIGAGGLLALLVLREVFTFLSARGRNGTAGDRPVEFWRGELRQGVSECLEASLRPVLEQQTVLLREIRDAVTRGNNGIQELIISSRQRRR